MTDPGTLHPAYPKLVERINRLPQGAPPSDSLYAILKLLVSPREAGLLACLPIKPFTVQQAAKNWKLSLVETQNLLESLASRAILLDTLQPDGTMLYVLPPPMAGFFEFQLMRVRCDIDQQSLGELFYQYCTLEPDFLHALFNHETQVGRIFVNEPLLPATEVLDYERASHLIRSARLRSVGLCYCRHKAQNLGHACGAPLEICMTLDGTAESLIRHQHARAVDPAEGIDLLQKAYDYNLVQFGENVRQGGSFLCNCCGCCCDALVGARRFHNLRPISTTHFLPVVNPASCTGCGKCVQVCPVQAMGLVSRNAPSQPRRMLAKLAEDLCLGCGVCARACAHNALQLQTRPQRLLTPLNTTHRLVMMAIEMGTLQDLIFDNRMLWSQRALAALLGSILNLPPVHQVLASRQVKSRYFEALIQKLGW